MDDKNSKEKLKDAEIKLILEKKAEENKKNKSSFKKDASQLANKAWNALEKA